MGGREVKIGCMEALDALALSTATQVRRDASTPGALHRRAARGELVRLRRGVYVDANAWSSTTSARRYASVLMAAAETRWFTPVFSHISAALIWGLPIIGRWPGAAHFLTTGQAGLHSKNGVVWHHDKIAMDDITVIGRVLVTTLERTLIDVAKSMSFDSAVASLDHATQSTIEVPGAGTYPGVPKAQLLDRLRRDGPRRGSARARQAIEFSDSRSGSPGESLSRVQIHRLGFPAPRLQTPIARSKGGFDFPDFEWDELFGEFDGYAKYTRDEYTRGREMAEIVWEEKLREDRLRATGKGMCRWTWDVALSLPALDARLRAAGLSPIRARSPRNSQRAESRRPTGAARR